MHPQPLILIPGADTYGGLPASSPGASTTNMKLSRSPMAVSYRASYSLIKEAASYLGSRHGQTEHRCDETVASKCLLTDVAGFSFFFLHEMTERGEGNLLCSD